MNKVGRKKLNKFPCLADSFFGGDHMFCSRAVGKSSCQMMIAFASPPVPRCFQMPVFPFHKQTHTHAHRTRTYTLCLLYLSFQIFVVTTRSRILQGIITAKTPFGVVLNAVRATVYYFCMYVQKYTHSITSMM